MNKQVFDLTGFVPIPGYEDRYMVNKKGDVYSYFTNELKEPTDTGDNLKVTLYKGNGGHSFSLLRLLAMTFIPNPENCPSVIARDGNNYNISIENAQWAIGSSRKSERLYRITTEDGKTLTMSMAGIVNYLGVSRRTFRLHMKDGTELISNNGFIVTKIEDMGLHKKERDITFMVTMNNGEQKKFTSVISMAEYLSIDLDILRDILGTNTSLSSAGNKDLFSIECVNRTYFNEDVEKISYIVRDIDGKTHYITSIPAMIDKFGLNLVHRTSFVHLILNGNRINPLVGSKGTIVAIKSIRLGKNNTSWAANGYNPI